MLPAPFSSFAEGLFGPLHSEFERAPKAASITTNPAVWAPRSEKSYSVKVHWPYVWRKHSLSSISLVG